MASVQSLLPLHLDRDLIDQTQAISPCCKHYDRLSNLSNNLWKVFLLCSHGILLFSESRALPAQITLLSLGKKKHIDDDVWKTHIQTWKSTTHENFKRSESICRGKPRTRNDPETSHLQSIFLHCDAHSCTCFDCFWTT